MSPLQNAPSRGGIWTPIIYSNRSFPGITQACHSDGIAIGSSVLPLLIRVLGGSVAKWLACWTQAQKGLRLDRSRDAVG